LRSGQRPSLHDDVLSNHHSVKNGAFILPFRRLIEIHLDRTVRSNEKDIINLALVYRTLARLFDIRHRRSLATWLARSDWKRSWLRTAPHSLARSEWSCS